VVTPDTLARFANNPFALLRAAMGSGLLKTYDQVPSRLDPTRLVGRAAAVDGSLLTRMASNVGAEWMATLVQAVLSSVTIAIAGEPSAEHLIAALLNCFPPEYRTEIPFSTGLKFSPRRPFRVVALSDDPKERRRVQRLYNPTVLDLNDRPPAEFAPTDAWSQFIYRVLKTGRTAFLACRFSEDRAEFSPEDLPALGLQYLEELDATSLAGGSNSPDAPPGTCRRFPVASCIAGPPRQQPEPQRQPPEPAGKLPPSDRLAHAHEGHARFEQESCSKTNAGLIGPSARLDPDDPHVLEKLEHLDDLVYDAIRGDRSAMDGLRTSWPRVRQELGEELLEESRAQYLRYAMSLWEGGAASDSISCPSRAVQALDVLCILFDAV
jgi:hypothetical protein